MKHIVHLTDEQPSRFIPDYNDGFFRLTIILGVSFFVATYGGASLVDSFNDPDFYPEFVATFAITALLTEWISIITRLLDKVYDWESQPVVRLLLQTVFGVVSPAIFEVFMATLWFRMIGTDIRETTFMNYAFTLILLLIIIFNVYYFVLYIYFQWKRKESGRMGYSGEQELPDSGGIPVYFGGSTKYIPAGEILFAYRLGKYNYIKTSDERGGGTYVISQPLDELEKALGDRMFFRLNRQLIAHRVCCKGYLSLRYGKLEVSLTPGSPIGEVAIVSQRRAPTFKKWIEA